jgi:hypothetical protein
MYTTADLDPSTLCNRCAQQVLHDQIPALLEIAAAALTMDAARAAMYADPGHTINKLHQVELCDSYEASVARFRGALAKVRP